MIIKYKATNLISFPLIISSTTPFPPFQTEYQTDVFMIQTKVTSFQLQDFSSWITRNCNTKAPKKKPNLLLINHFLAKKIRSAQGFSNVTQQRCCSTLPPCLGVIRLPLAPARTWLMAISRLWLPAPVPSCAEPLLSLCSLWVRAN